MRIVPTAETVAALRRAVAGAEAHLPILASGAVAFVGQMTFAKLVLGWPFLGQVLYGLAVELFGYGMARLAARVRRAGDRGVLAMASAWVFSVYAGVCNYWHASPSWAPNPTAVSLGVASVAGLGAFFVHEHYAVRSERRKLGVVAPAHYVAAEPVPAVATRIEASDVARAFDVPVELLADAPSSAVAAAVVAPSAPVAATSRVSDGPSRSALARIYLDKQRENGRLHEVDGPEVMRESGLGQSRAREVLREYRRDVAA